MYAQVGIKNQPPAQKRIKKKIYQKTDLLTNKKKCRITTFKKNTKKQNTNFKPMKYKLLLNKAQASYAKENTAVSC